MTDEISTPEPPATPRQKKIQIRWHRVALYTGSIAVSLMMWICALLYMIRFQPERFVAAVFAELPFPHSYGRVVWLNRRTLEIDNVKWGDFFYADSIVVTASPWGLLRHHVAKLQIIGGQVFTGPLYDEMDKHSGVSEGLNWTIARLEISRGTILLQNYGPDIPSIPIRMGVRQPVVLNNVKLNKPDNSPGMMKERMVELTNVNIASPFDPVSRVLAFPLVRVRFTYTEMWHHHIREVIMIRPTMYLGQDLFWFVDEFKKQRASRPMEGATAPWQVDHLAVQYGRLAVAAFGQPVAILPFFFETQVDDIRLDQLDKISAKSTIAIKRLDQDFPDYKIRIENLTGNLYFSLPPSDVKANNVVTDIKIASISWNDIPVTNPWTSVTFDAQGVYGKLNGACEGGQLSGNFEFYYSKGFAWNVDFFADKINCQPIAEKLGGKYLNMTGTLDGDIKVQGKVTDIQNCQGLLKLTRPGVLEFKSLDRLLAKAKGQLSLKDQAMQIAVENFRTYPYETGEFKVDYTPAGGGATLKLNSANGLRQFEIFYHPFGSSEVAKDNNNR